MLRFVLDIIANIQVSDWFGLAGSALLLVPPSRDQWLRRKADIAGRLRGDDPDGLGRLRLLASRKYQQERHAYSGYDTAMMALGAFFLGVSYIL
ncbi:MAG: hypothetical protein Q8Q62_11080 [Mesorhizobium sp.]|nr:hypothetical protein [Mesorhizobium sp.]